MENITESVFWKSKDHRGSEKLVLVTISTALVSVLLNCSKSPPWKVSTIQCD